MTKIDRSKFEELLARAKANAAAAAQVETVAAADQLSTDMEKENVVEVDLSRAGISAQSIETSEGREAAVDVIGEIISRDRDKDHVPGVARAVTLNVQQDKARQLALAGRSFVLIGAGGTGKTTATGIITKELIGSGVVGKIINPTKWLHIGGYGAAVVAFTRKAVNNIRYAVADELKQHVVTIHKLLEYAPVYYEVEDPERPGSFKKTMIFEPQRCETKPLPPELKLIIHEESSMESVDLYHNLQVAMPHEHQEIFLGDIQQLPPVMGLAILGFKMVEKGMEVVELTEPYRQALESPIMALAWKILGGKANDFHPRTETYRVYSPFVKKEVDRIRVPSLEALSVSNDKGVVKLHPWQKRLPVDTALDSFVKQCCTWADTSYYDPDEDIILCPFGVSFGTIEINKGISQHLGTKRGAIVHEVIAGFNKHYLAIGDRVLYDKEDATVVSIERNGNYLGAIRPQPASVNLDRWGHQRTGLSSEEVTKMMAEDMAVGDIDVDAFFENIDSDTGKERVTAASHIVTVKMRYGDTDETEPLDSAKEINALLGGYAITVHKSQGSEYNRVFIALHHSHAQMVSRELLYTAVSRAKRFLHVVCEVDTFFKGIKTQRIQGNTLAEKAEFFKGKSRDYEAKKKDMEIRKGAASTFQPDVSNKSKTGPVMVEASKSSSVEKQEQPKLRLADIVPETVRATVQKNMDTYWERIKSIYGERAGIKPLISYNLRSRRTLGLAKLRSGIIVLNPVWSAISESNDAIKKEMTEVTLLHELCHIVAWRISKDDGHGKGWSMAMQIMGLNPEVTYKGNDLPNYMEAYEYTLDAKLKQLKYDGMEEITEQPLSEGDVA